MSIQSVSRRLSGSPSWLWRAGALVLLAGLVLLARESATHSIDFPVYHHTARQVIAGNYELYPPEAYGGQPVPSQGFRYPPAIAALFVPFGWLPLELAALAFFSLKLGAVWYIGTTVARHVGVQGRRRQVIVIAFLVVGGYLVEEFRFGNVHFLCVALMLFAYDRTEAGRVLAPAAALSIAIAIKLTPLALLAYFAVRRRTAVCVATVAVLGLLIVLPASVLGSAGNMRQLRAYANYAAEKLDERDNYALRGVLERYFTPHRQDASYLDVSMASLSSTTVTVLWIAGVLGLGLTGLFAAWREDDNPVVRLLEFSIVLTGTLLASPHSQRRYFVALYVPVAVLVALLTQTPHTHERRTIYLGLLAVALSGTVLPLVFIGRHLSLVYEAGSPYFFGTLILFGALVMMTVDRKGAPQPLTVAGASPDRETERSPSRR